MPFHTPRHSHSISESSQPHDNYYAIYNNSQTVNSAGSPTTNWTAQSHNPNAPSDQHPYQLPQPNGNGMNIPYRAAPPPNTLPSQHSTEPHPSQYLHSRRISTLSGQAHEVQPQHSGSAMSDVHHYGAPPAYAGDNVSINVQPSTPGHAPGSGMPGALQPGQGNNRPQVMGGSNTAPQLPTLPNLPQISTQMQQQQQQRPANLSQTHSYSRSSPGGMEQPKYKPFSNTPEQNKYNSPTSYVPHTPQGLPSYSPLGLADIRPRADTTLSEGNLFSPPATQDNDIMQYPTSSNYVAPWPIYAADWCKWPPRSSMGSAGKVAIGSYLEDGHNYIQVLDASIASVDPDQPGADPGFEFTKTAEATHAYPVTRILWEPPSSNKQTTDLLATSGDHLRLWSLPAEPTSSYSSSISRKDQPLQKLSPLALLSNSKSPEHTAPITSLDWNVVQPSLIITSSIDTTCTIWDIPTLTAKTQLIAHDKEVYDVRYVDINIIRPLAHAIQILRQ
jgi:DDB1- and CUL4-associated factor 7